MRQLKGRSRSPAANNNTSGPEQRPRTVLLPEGGKKVQHEAGVAVTNKKKVFIENSLRAWENTQRPGGEAGHPTTTIFHDLISFSTSPPGHFPRASSDALPLAMRLPSSPAAPPLSDASTIQLSGGPRKGPTVRRYSLSPLTQQTPPPWLRGLSALGAHAQRTDGHGRHSPWPGSKRPAGAVVWHFPPSPTLSLLSSPPSPQEMAVLHRVPESPAQTSARRSSTKFV